MHHISGHFERRIPVLLFLVGILQACSSSRPSDVIETGPVQISALHDAITADTLNIRIPGSAVAFRMIPIAGGESLLGRAEDPESGPGNEIPAVHVQISPFWMSETEVMYDAFAIFRFKDRDSDSTAVEGIKLPIDAVARPSTPYEDPSFGMDGPGFPAVGMTQWAALHYARWLSMKTGRFFRLPTEAEWEFACLSGTGLNGSLHANASSGNASSDTPALSLDKVAWFAENSENHLQPVARKHVDFAGLFDMRGNVAEWTLDQYDEIFYTSLSDESTPVHDPWRVPEKLHPRTVRGGHYSSDRGELGCRRRVKSDMRWKRRDPQIPKSFWWNTDSPFVGFRLISPIEPPAPGKQDEFWSLVLGE